MKFHQLAVDEPFTNDRYGACVKVSGTQYRTADGRIHHTIGTANVNGPAGDRARAATVADEQRLLNEIAVAAGFRNWYELGRHALAGSKIIIN